MEARKKSKTRLELSEDALVLQPGGSYRLRHQLSTAPAPASPVVVAEPKTTVKIPKPPNKTEALYRQTYLVPRQYQPVPSRIVVCRFEDVTLRLGYDCRYTTDWYVEREDGRVEFHEVKGPKEWEDSIVKLKCAAAQFPFLFYLARRASTGHWKILTFARDGSIVNDYSK